MSYVNSFRVLNYSYRGLQSRIMFIQLYIITFAIAYSIIFNTYPLTWDTGASHHCTIRSSSRFRAEFRKGRRNVLFNAASYLSNTVCKGKTTVANVTILGGLVTTRHRELDRNEIKLIAICGSSWLLVRVCSKLSVIPCGIIAIYKTGTSAAPR